MRIADAVNKSDDNFSILMSYRGKVTFSQEACAYGGEEKIVYDIKFGGGDMYAIAGREISRDELFAAFDKFSANLLKYTTIDENPYSAVLVFENGKLEPILTVDVSSGYGGQQMLLVFGESGETVALSYDRVDLRERLRRALLMGVDMRDVRRGSEEAVKMAFGMPELAEVLPPSGKEEKTDGHASESGSGPAGAGVGGADGGGDTGNGVSEAGGQDSVLA